MLDSSGRYQDGRVLYLNDIFLVEQEVLELLRVSPPGPVGVLDKLPHGDTSVCAPLNELLDVSVQVGPVADVPVVVAVHLALLGAAALLDVHRVQHLLVRVYSHPLEVLIFNIRENVDSLQDFLSFLKCIKQPP